MTNSTTDAAREKVWATLRGYLRDSFGGTDFAYVDEALDAYAAAVSRARDAAWREAVEGEKRENPACCAPEGMCETDAMSEGAHAALDALLARMDGAK